MIIDILNFDEEYDVKRSNIKVRKEKKLKIFIISAIQQKQKIMLKIKMYNYHNIYKNSDDDNYDDDDYYYFMIMYKIKSNDKKNSEHIFEFTKLLIIIKLFLAESE